MHRIPRYIIGTVFCVVLGAGLLFVVLTRTEVGRDALRVQLERSFSAEFDGTLSIGRLSGNLLNDLYAREVVFRDPAGRAVLRIDSVSVRPRWMDFFRETVSVRSATLFNPRVDLVRNADGRWNIEEVFHSGRTRTESSPWKLSGANLTILNGSIQTQNRGPELILVGNGTVFDFTNARFERLDARATVDWRSDFRLVDLLQLSGSLPDLDIDVHSIRGQFLNGGDATSLNHVSVRIGGSSLNMSAHLDNFDLLTDRPDAFRLSDAAMRVSIVESFVNGDEMVRLIPALPLGGRVGVEALVEGALSDLNVRHLRLLHENTDVTASGTVRGLPDFADIAYDIPSGTIDVRDVAELLPYVDLGPLAPEQTITLASSGNVSINAGSSVYSARSTLRAAGGFGTIEGSVQARKTAAAPVEYTIDLTTQNVDVNELLADMPFETTLNGRLSLKGRGTSQHDLLAQVDGNFYSTVIAGRAADTLQVSGTLQGYRFEGASLFVGDGGALWASGFVDLNGIPEFDVQTRAEDFDVRRLVTDAGFSTRLNGSIAMAGSGSGPDRFDGSADMQISRSSITHENGQWTIPAFQTDIAVATRDANLAVLRIGGDLLEGTVEGRFTLPLVARTAELWTHGIRRSILQTLDKPVGVQTVAAAADPESDSVFSLLNDYGDFDRMHVLRADLAAELSAVNLSSVQVEANLQIKRADVLGTLIPMLHDVDLAGTTRIRLDATEGRMTFSASGSADSISVGGVGIVQPRVTMNTGAVLEPGREAVVSLSIGGRARSAVGARRDLRDLTVDLHFQESVGRFETTVSRIGESGYLELSARIDHFRDRNQFTIENFRLGVQDRIWNAVNHPRIDVYRDALVFHHIMLENLAPNGDGDSGHAQQIAIDGAVSSSRRDTVFVTAENIVLDDISELIALKDPIGGRLNGQVAVTAIDPHLEAVGDLDIKGLTFIGRALGDARLVSRYVPGADLIEIDLAVQQSDTLAVWMQNDVHISGAVHLGNSGRINETGGQDLFDLAVNINSLDLFFFEKLFPDLVDNVEARVFGSGRIRGDFRYPLFYADLQLPAGRFDVPAFNLSYEISGPFSVDRAGFHLSEIRLTDPTGGRTHVSGRILFNNYRFFSFDLSGRLDDILIMNVPSSRELPFYGRIWLSGTASLTGPISSAFLRSADLVANRRSQLFIPVTGGTLERDEGFIVFADSTGRIPDLSLITRRAGILADRPPGERDFLDGLEMSLNITAPRGSTVHLVFDPLLGDVINAVGSGRIQLQLLEGEFATYGSFDIESGDYLFTAGEVFTRRFLLESGGTITWDGDPIDARLQIPAVYRTRASLVGLPGYDSQQRVPLLVRLDVSGRVQAPAVGLSLQIARDDRTAFGAVEGLESLLNQSDRAAEYATSVLLTNTFLLTTTTGTETLPGAADDLFFNSVSQLVANQLNRFVNQALTNVELTLGVQSASTQDLDLTYGIALRLLDERLIIRGTGVYESAPQRGRTETLQGEFIVEVRLSPRVSVEAFYRREEDLSNFTSVMYGSYGAGVNYQADFVNWRQFLAQITRWFRNWLP